MFAAAYGDNKLLAIKWLFFASDVRGGMGERRIFRICIDYIASTDPSICRKLIPLIPEYSRWDNLFALEETEVFEDVCSFIKDQLEKDLSDSKEGKSVSLCAKWMPSENASSKETKRLARLLAKKTGYTAGQYRRLLSALRKYIDVVEVKMSEGSFDKIDYSAVPSRANLLYKKAFLNRDAIRRYKFLSDLSEGKEKINSSVLFPHEIVYKYIESQRYDFEPKPYDQTLEELWKALPDFVNGDETTMCVVDGSGSMCIGVGKTNVPAWSVAAGLAIYFSERCRGQYKDRFITFSENPQMVDISGAKSLHDKIIIARSHNEVADTNVEAVFDLILTTAVENDMDQNDLPKNILILSDMEFNECARANDDSLLTDKLFVEISKRYKKYGYELPRLVFWNINGRSMSIPLKQNALGVALVSGFSPTVVKMVLSNELDPLKVLIETLDSDRYRPVEKALQD